MLKIGATTLGETGGDAVSMSMNLGYLVSSLIFMAIFIVVVIAQISTHRFRAPLYWTTILATTTVGTTVADFADRSLGIGYAGGTSLLFSLPMIGGVSEREDHGEALSSVVAQWVCSLIELYGGFAALC